MIRATGRRRSTLICYAAKDTKIAELQSENASLRAIVATRENDLAAKDAKIARLQTALEESVKLCSHGAQLLNVYDNGRRRTFNNAQEWIDRLNYLGMLPILSPSAKEPT